MVQSSTESNKWLIFSLIFIALECAITFSIVCIYRCIANQHLSYEFSAF